MPGTRHSASSRSVTRGQHRFAQVPDVKTPRSVFNRSCSTKTTFDAGKLIPIFLDEALPGDTMSMQTATFARLATPLFPIMDNLYIDTHFFFVPMRLVWDNFQKFMGEQTDPGDSVDFTVPEMTIGGPWIAGTPADYFGVPTIVTLNDHNSLPFRCYNLIWNEWFRDENLQDSVVVDKDDGPDSAFDYIVVLDRGKRHDYFTSCLPWPQKGDAVELPLGTTAPVVSAGDGIPIFDVGTSLSDRLEASGSGTNPDVRVAADGTQSTGDPLVWNDTKLATDLSSATAATINQIRQAFQVQKLYEKDARGGTRYTEVIRAHFGVVSPDARLQRPEYLGGSSMPMLVNAVPATTEGTGQNLGDLAAYGIAIDQAGTWTKSFTEHGYIIGLASVRADLHYQQGLPRLFSRSTRLDFYWPSLAHLGEQSVLNKEIFADGSANDDLVFGYQERFAEYRYKPSIITGILRSNAAAGTLDAWHLAQDFASLPVLNATFIAENPPVDRVIATPTDPHIIFDARFNYKCVRPMPTYSVPGFIDHF